MDENAIINDLLEAIRHGSKDQFAPLAAQLSPNGRATAVPQIAHLLQSSADDDVRRQAVLVLTELKREEAIPYLGQLVLADADPLVRQLALSGLEAINLGQAVPYFLKLINDPNERLKKAARHALGIAIEQFAAHLDSEDPFLHDPAGDFLAQISAETLGEFLLLDDRLPVQSAAVRMLGALKSGTAVTILCRAANELNASDLLWAIIAALRQIGGPEAVKCIGQRFMSESNRDLRWQAASSLAQLGQPTAVPYLARALIREEDNEVREIIVSALNRQIDWQAKTSATLTTLESSPLERANVNGAQIIEALRPNREQTAVNRHLLTDHLLERASAYKDDPRMTAILAALIIASAEGSMSLAGERLNLFQQERNLSDDDLQMLRIEIGGATALSPILAELKQNLAENFQKPIAQLNDHTQRMWRITIVFAQIGFLARTLMSIVLFIVGVYLVLDSYWQVMAGNLAAEQLVGTTVSFSSGIITMLLMVYRGPLREIRQSVNDLGIASAAFIAYVHRVLQISHTFSAAYLRQKISFEEMEKSSRLIDEAMASTIKLLREPNKSEQEDGNGG